MKNKKVLDTLGIVTTVAGILITILSDSIAQKQTEQLIDEKVEEKMKEVFCR